MAPQHSRSSSNSHTWRKMGRKPLAAIVLVNKEIQPDAELIEFLENLWNTKSLKTII
jgi:hypothetical protein